MCRLETLQVLTWEQLLLQTARIVLVRPQGGEQELHWPNTTHPVPNCPPSLGIMSVFTLSKNIYSLKHFVSFSGETRYNREKILQGVCPFLLQL